MKEFRESGLNIRFSERYWAVRQYDVHPYYRALTRAGLKGVDFVAVSRDNRILLMEVKNFTNSREPIPNPENLSTEIQRKIEETMQGMEAIYRMLERKWLFRQVQSFLPYFLAHQYDWPFWARVGRLLSLSERIDQIALLVGAPASLIREVDGYLRQSLPGTQTVTLHTWAKMGIALKEGDG